MNRSLSKRQSAEKEYHNNKYHVENYYALDATSQLSYVFFYSLVNDVKNKKILDFGCGNGWLSFQLEKQGASVWGIDISEELIKIAKRLENNNINFQVMPGENLEFGSNFFDIIIGNSILHHTELKSSIKEIERVLNHNGSAVFIEPMNENIILKFWRLVTPWRRSADEKALDYNDIQYINSVFPESTFHYFSFLSILPLGLSIICPNSNYIVSLIKFFDKIDSKILAWFPRLDRYCAVVVMEMKKN